MCIGNRKSSALKNFNSHLATQWEIAEGCANVLRTGNFSSEDLLTIERRACIYEYLGPPMVVGGIERTTSVEGPYFFLFNPPRVEVTCDHEATLILEICGGHFMIDGRSQRINHKESDPESKITVHLRLRLLTRPGDKFVWEEAGASRGHKVDLYALDIGSYTPERTTIRGIDDENVVMFHRYLGNYLKVFKSAGYHILYSLPDFDQIETGSYIDFTDGKAFESYTSSMNETLQKQFSAAFSQSVKGDILVEHEVEVEDVYMHMEFKEMRVKGSCEHNAVLEINISEIVIRRRDVRTVHKEWKLAFVINGPNLKTHGGHPMLDLSSAVLDPRYTVIPASSRAEFDSIFNQLVGDITGVYFDTLAKEKANVFFKGEEPFTKDDIDGCLCPSRSTCPHKRGITWGIWGNDLTRGVDMHKFDTVTVVNQGFINFQFEQLFAPPQLELEEASGNPPHYLDDANGKYNDIGLSQWSYPDVGEAVFHSKFDAPKVQLNFDKDPSQGSAILFLYLKSGALRLLREDSNLERSDYQFSNVRLAYRVDLKLDDEQAGFDGSQGHLSYKHLMLDLDGAQFDRENSSLRNLSKKEDRRLYNARCKALRTYIKHYFNALKTAGVDVLYTFPVSKPVNGAHPPSFRIQFLPFVYNAHKHKVLQGLTGFGKVVYDRNAIAILGVADGHAIPEKNLPLGTNWIAGTKDNCPKAMMFVSKDRIFRALEVVNQCPLVIPHFVGTRDSDWFMTWLRQGYGTNRLSAWSKMPQEPTEDHVQYGWRDNHTWQYMHEWGNKTEVYTVKCAMQNTLSIPSDSRSKSYSLSLDSEITLKLSCSGRDSNWSAEIVAKWPATVELVKGDKRGFTFSISPEADVPAIQVTQRDDGSDDNVIHKVSSEIAANFPVQKDLDSITSALNNSLRHCALNLDVARQELSSIEASSDSDGGLIFEFVDPNHSTQVNVEVEDWHITQSEVTTPGAETIIKPWNEFFEQSSTHTSLYEMSREIHEVKTTTGGESGRSQPSLSHSQGPKGKATEMSTLHQFPPFPRGPSRLQTEKSSATPPSLHSQGSTGLLAEGSTDPNGRSYDRPTTYSQQSVLGRGNVATAAPIPRTASPVRVSNIPGSPRPSHPPSRSVTPDRGGSMEDIGTQHTHRRQPIRRNTASTRFPRNQSSMAAVQA